MADISKELDKKVKQMAIGDTLGNIIVTSKKLRDQLRSKEEKFYQVLQVYLKSITLAKRGNLLKKLI